MGSRGQTPSTAPSAFAGPRCAITEGYWCSVAMGLLGEV